MKKHAFLMVCYRQVFLTNFLRILKESILLIDKYLLNKNKFHKWSFLRKFHENYLWKAKR